jgi:copper oxidase (laccase) domain-containing protein
MTLEFDTAPADLYAAIGPSIRGCCYEVGASVAAHFERFFPEWQPVGEKCNLDLAEANRRQMLAAGVERDHIFDCGLCTACQDTQFFSYRRDPKNPGRMIASICRLA